MTTAVLKNNSSEPNRSGLAMDPKFREFVETELLPLTGLDVDQFWSNIESILSEFMPLNAGLLAKRDNLQQQIDEWHQKNDYASVGKDVYKTFLQEMGYLVEDGDDFQIETANVDAEIATMAGPQLVVPVKNARFALNAVNARWGSLYDAMYGTDVIDQQGTFKHTDSYNPIRGQEVINRARDFLDQVMPLKQGSHHDVTAYQIYYKKLAAILKDGTYAGLADPKQFVAYNGSENEPSELVFKHNGLLIEMEITADSQTGQLDLANVKDIRLESAITTIMDCEDSIAAVDTEDKIAVYRNWLGLMSGDLSETFAKGDQTISRSMNRDSTYHSPAGDSFRVRRRGLMFVRNVGHLMTIDTIRNKEGEPIPEGILDGIFTVLIGSIDLQKKPSTPIVNSQTGSIYIVKPKMHGPEEVDFTCKLFSRIEEALCLPENTVKLGIMDEERRTTLNLKECIRAAKSRCVFINTGFLDRTGDEIHTSMEAGAFLPKDQIKQQCWIDAYENRNVDIGLACGFQGKAQIGKGMWPKPDEMAEMMATKQAHPLSGANTAWVPSPTAATLHAMHYHQIDVFAEQDKLKSRKAADVNDLITLPLLTETLTDEQIEQELANNIQGILGYVVRWIDQGVGCSKVPDIHNVGLMEDRATLRISSQHIANWLRHEVCTESQVMTLMESMAKVVDGQNAADASYTPMAENTQDSLAFQAAKDLIFKGVSQPNGYTEPLLHEYRLKAKQAQKSA